jgi:hypothetical protein
VYCKLAGAHTKAVSALLPLGSVEPGGADRIISASLDGTIAVWDPSSQGRSAGTPGGPAECVATVAFKAHDAAVASVAFFRCLNASPEQPPLRLITAGGAATPTEAHGTLLGPVWHQDIGCLDPCLGSLVERGVVPSDAHRGGRSLWAMRAHGAETPGRAQQHLGGACCRR